MSKYALEVENVGIKFNLSSEKIDSLKDYVLKSIKREVSFDEFWALRNVSFKVEKGDRLGILGINGAGKSTLLKVIAGVYKPTEGRVIRRGNIAPLLELGAGFDRQYTGRENIYLYGAMLGYTKSFIDSKYEEIVKFSGLRKFIDVPVKNYSSGMKSRLGFAIATIVNPEILILDEVLSVGDTKFRRKSERKIRKMFDDGATVLFVSHSLPQVRRLCNKAMLLEHGRLIAFGSIDEVSAIYERMVGLEPEIQTPESKPTIILPPGTESAVKPSDKSEAVPAADEKKIMEETDEQVGNPASQGSGAAETVSDPQIPAIDPDEDTEL